MSNMESKDNILINIGTGNLCCFVPMSLFLIKQLKIYPLLFYAIEEALKCAEIGCYGIGIIAFSQALNIFNKKTPLGRHEVAHSIFERRPTKKVYEVIFEKFKKEALDCEIREMKKQHSFNEYKEKVIGEWKQLMKELHNIEIEEKEE